MQIRRTIIIAAAILALVAGGTAALASPGAAGPPSPQVVNLAQAFKRALPHVKHEPRAGIVVPVGKRHRPAASSRHRPAAMRGAACAEPNCNLVYHSGPVQHSPHVYILLWGPNWPQNDPQYGVEWNMFHGLGVTSHDTWSTITSQYGDGSGNPAFGSTVFVNAYHDTTAPPNPVTPADIAAEADALATQLGVQASADTQIVVSAQSGTCYSDGYAGNCGAPDPNGIYCAYHSSSNEPYTNLPYQTDAGNPGCGENMVNPGSAGIYDAVSLTAGHEYAESITDPFPDTGWIDLADAGTSGSGGEIGDKCVNDAQNLTLSTSAGLLKFAMQFLWSNAAGRCVMTTDRVSVTSPGNRASTIGTAVSLQLHATSSAGLSLSYRATGLPSGLSISSAGLITGTPSVTAATYTTKITATDAAGTSAGSASFSWFVKSGTGVIKGYLSKCADDSRDLTANGNKIDISTCTGRTPQKFTFLANGELTVAGKCIRDNAGRVILYTCNGTTAEQWTRHSNGEYVIRYNGTCLTAPSAVNGTQLTLARCTGSSHQVWSLP